MNAMTIDEFLQKQAEERRRRDELETERFLQERRERAAEIRRQADADDRRAAEFAEDNPMYCEYLHRRAQAGRYLANETDGGYGQ